VSGLARSFLRRFADQWLVLGMLGALLALSLLLVHVPASLWAGNTGEFHWRFGTFLRLGLTALAAAFAAVVLMLAILPRTPRAVVASLLCAMGLVGWVYASFLTGDMVALNGSDPPMSFDTRLGAWELGLVAAAYVLIGLAVARARSTAIVAILVLNIGLAAGTAVSVKSVRRHRVKAPLAQDTAPVFRFSTRDNVLIVLLDGLQSDFVDDIFRKDSQLKSVFDGFRFYRNTLGVAPTTFVSMPAIHSGREYRPSEGLATYFQESIRFRSFMSRFADSGYDTALVNPIDAVCPDRVRTCVFATQILQSGEAQLRSESLRLFDVSLFRLAPMWVKKRIYDDGNWFLAGWFGMTEETHRILEHNAMFGEIARRVTVDAGAPTLKFIHSLATHTPFVLNGDCHTLGRGSWSRMPPQARCALLGAAALLNALKAAGVYDRTEIVLMADHGLGRPTHYADPDVRSAQWARRAGSANPVFLLKPRRARGAIKDDVANVYLPDLGTTLCASSGACAISDGAAVGHAPPDRTRRYLDYVWKHQFWYRLDIPGLTLYEVRGPLWEERSWQRVDDAMGE
jgi:hypothetical protein